MKKRNWLMTIAFAVLSLTIISTAVIGSTYAKFTSKVSADAGVRAAGFNVSGTNAAAAAFTATTPVVAPAGSQTAAITFTYYSQVLTEFTATGDGYTLTGLEVFENYDITDTNDEDYSELKSGYAAWLAAKQAKGEFVGAVATAFPAALTDMFSVSFTSDAAGNTAIAGTNMAEAFAAAVRAQATADSVTLATTETGARVGAMPAEANAVLTISDSMYVKITWTEFNDAWDTYVGEQVAAGNLTGAFSGIKINLDVTASQVTA